MNAASGLGRFSFAALALVLLLGFGFATRLVLLAYAAGAGRARVAIARRAVAVGEVFDLVAAAWLITARGGRRCSPIAGSLVEESGAGCEGWFFGLVACRPS
jgi:hypothetical protein